MKKLILIIALFLFAFACEDKVSESNFGFNGELQLKHGQIVYSDNNDISLEILNINDSRCPSDVVCIWAGEARIFLEFKNTTTTIFELCTGGPLKDTIDNYIFELMNVSPYPVSTETLELDDYTIKLNITEL
ncbi:MAG: hypothetical protein JW833_00820 [Prolixibacteraceae bacterium]|nr:hypothetical protein [Prolixibacteraceae bacterium]